MSLEIIGPLHETISVNPRLTQEQRTDYSTQLAFILGNIACEHPDYDMTIMKTMAEWYSKELDREETQW